ncbi:MAG: hypothetical protein K6U74_09870 [Firmicutes bacterium]|nr:hypothetical protein [Bacillota bacterium]
MFGLEWNAFLPGVLSLWRIALPAIFLGCLLGSLLKDTALWVVMGKLMYPLAKLGRLSRGSATFLAFSLINYFTAKTLLASMKLDGKMEDNEIVFSYLVSAFPSGVHFLIFYIAPALFSSLGWRLGLIYSSLYVLINLIICVTGLLMGRKIARGGGVVSNVETEKPGDIFAGTSNVREKIVTSLKTAVKQFYRLALVFMPVTLFSGAMLKHPAVIELLGKIAPLLDRVGLPAPALLAIAAGIPSMMAGIATMGPVVKQGLLTEQEVLVTLLIVSILHSFYELFSSVMATNISIFGANLGFRLTFTALAVRVAASLSLIVCIVLLY